MKRQLFFGTLCAAALTVGISAQTPQTPPSSTPQTPRTPSTTQPESHGKNQEVTLTGCLQSGSGASTTGTTGTAASGAQKSGSSSMSGGEFILANAKMGGSSGASAAGTAGSPTGAASSSSSTADRYKLVGHTNDLRKYANSQVEVHGTIDSKASSSSGAGATPSASASSASSEPTLRVSSVKQISPSCSGGN
jgi:hypothetical protein